MKLDVCVATVLLAAGLSGCWSAPIPAEPRSMGERLVTWNSLDDPGVHSLQPVESLVTDSEGWDTWVSELPADLREARRGELDQVDLTEAVALVAVWDGCGEDTQVVDLAVGRLDFVIIPRDDDNICEVVIREVEVWRVGLAEMGVGDVSEVTLN